MPGTSVQVYLFFDGNCEEAVEFYKKALGAEVEMIARYSDSPEPMPEGSVKPGYENKIMHASFKVGDTTIMASDNCMTDSPHKGFSLSINAGNEADARRYFDALSEGGHVEMPLSPTFWSPLFGMLTDKFGIGWMVSVPHKAG